MRHLRRTSRAVVVGTLVASLLNLSPIGARAGDDEHLRQGTPIKHVVVIFQENVSFDHYFATYPHAANLPGESVFTARHHVPQIDTLLNAGLLAPHNPNSVQPFRLSRAQNDTCDQDHGYTDEQAAMNGGKVDRFVETVGVGGPGCADYGVGRGLVMGYYDGSTVTALWNYARHFAMSDHFFNTTFGPSSPGALNLIAGQTGGAIPADLSTPFGADSIAGAVISDPQPFFDDCTTRDNVMMTGRNVGDLLNARNISWGFFQGGFKPTTPATFAADGRVTSPRPRAQPRTSVATASPRATISRITSRSSTTPRRPTRITYRRRRWRRSATPTRRITNTTSSISGTPLPPASCLR